MQTQLLDKQTVLFRSVLIVIVLCAVSVFLMVTARFLNRAPDIAYPDYGDVKQFDPAREGGHLLPNQNMLVRGAYADRPVRIITNSKGFRNAREFGYQVPAGTKRILLLGDSYVDGMRTDQEDTIGFVLEKELNRGSQNETEYEVLISGHSSPADAWYYFQEHGHKYNPHLVILGVTLGNDLTSRSYRTSVVPTRAPDGSVHLEPAQGSLLRSGKRQDLLLPTEAYLPRSSFDFLTDLEFDIRHFLEKRFNRFSRSVPPRMAPRISRRRAVYANGFFTSIGLFYRPTMTEVSEMYENFEEILDGFNSLATRSGSHLLVVLFPTRIQVSEKDWRLLLRAYSLDETKFDLHYTSDRIMTFCTAHSIDCLDLLPAFKEAEINHRTPLYRPRGDMHFSEEGQRLAADVIGKHVSGASALLN